MNALFTKEEQRVIIFLVVVVLVGSIVLFIRNQRADFAAELLLSSDEEYPSEFVTQEVNQGMDQELSDTGISLENKFKPRKGLPPGVRININTASAQELEFLPRVGPATAQKIIEYREQQGPFRSIEDIMKVKGIGPKTFQDMKDNLTVENP